MRARALSARRVFVRHRWAAVLFESRVLNPSPVRLRYSNAVLGLLRQDGFTISMAYRAFLLIDSYLYGFIMQEVNWPEIPQVTREATMPLSMGDYPHLIEAMEHVMTMSAPASSMLDTEFEYGLELILDCLALLRDTEAAGSSAAGTAAATAPNSGGA